MSYMILGPVVVDVLTDSGDGVEPFVIGAEVETFAGNLRSTRRAVKRRWRRVTRRMTDAQVATLLATIGAPMGGNVVAMTGTIVSGASVNVSVTVEKVDDIKQTGAEVRRRLTLFLKEV